MKSHATAILLLLGSLVCGMAAQGAGRKSEPSQAQENSKAATRTSNADATNPDGGKLFQTHCNRCHNAPDELSPRVARTVVQHMRVRGMLSEKDVQAILNYIAPE